VRGRIHWPSDPVIVRVSADGDFEVLSHVLDCAWWTRDYHDYYDEPIKSINGSIEADHGRKNSDKNVYHEAHSLWHGVFDKEERIEWLEHSRMQRL
jgi:hypothetical protein